MNYLIVKLLSVCFAIFIACSAFAGPGITTYQAKIIKPDGLPLEANSVNFKFTILNPVGNCILYSETYSSINMTSTGGLIAFPLGSGVKVYPVSATTFAEVFSNVTPNLSCDAGGPGTYTPAASDTRKVVMQFHDGGGWQTLPAMSINAVPYAMYANEAQKISGLPTCNPGEALSYNGVTFSCEVISGGGAVTSSTVTAALGYTPASSATVDSLVSSVASDSANISSVSATVYSVSTTVTSLQNSVAASFTAMASSQWASLNGLTSVSQTIAFGTTGAAPNVSSVGSVHTFNFPFASVGTTTAGVISNSDYAIFANKITSSAASIAQVLGYVPAASGAVPTGALLSANNLSDLTSSAIARDNLGLGGFATISSLDLGSASATGTLAEARLLSFANVVSGSQYTKVTVDGKGRVTSGAQLALSDVTTALGYVPASASASSQWITSGTTINYTTGNVGIGTANPTAKLQIGSGQILVPDGTATSPSLAFTSASGTGVYANTSNQLSITIVGSQTVRVNSNSTTFFNTPIAWSATDPVYKTMNIGSVINGSSLGKISFVDGNAITTGTTNMSVVATETHGTASQGSALKFSTIKNGTTTEVIRMIIDHDGSVGIGTSAPITKLDVSGGLRISMESAACTVSYAGTLRYNASTVEYCNGTTWSAFGVSGAGLQSFNGSTSGTQSFAIGAGGTAPSIATANGVHTFSIPYAASSTVTAGLLSNADYTTFTNKLNATSAAVISALEYIPVASGSIVGSQWSTSGTQINYMAGSIGIGTVNPQGKFNVTDGDVYIGTGTLINGSAQEDLFVEGNAEIHGDQGLTIGSTAGGFLISSGNTNRRFLSLTGSGTSSTDSSGFLILGNNRATAASGDIQGTIEFGSSSNGGSSANRSGARIETRLTGSGGANGFGAYTAFWTKSDNVAALTERMRISDSGNVGIGTTAPTAKLDVSGSLLVKSDIVNHDSSDFRSALSLTHSGTGTGYGNGSTVVQVFDNMEVVNFENGYLMFKTQDLERMRITAAGNVGVGIAAPTARLHLASGTTSVAPLRLTSSPLLTTAVSGAIEYDGTELYFTDGTNTRRAIASTGAPGYYDTVNTVANSSGNIALYPNTGAGSVIVSATTASTNSSTGALIVKGGLGVAGNIFSSGTIITSSNIQGASITATNGMITPYVYGSIVSGGSLHLDSTTHASKGNILLAPNGGNVGVGITAPTGKFHVVDSTGGNLIKFEQQYNGSSGAYLELIHSRAGGSLVNSDFTGGIYFRGMNSGGLSTVDSANIFSQMTNVVSGAESGNLTFYTRNNGTRSEKMRIDPNGNVGLGTATPGTLLDLYAAASPTLRIRSASNDPASGPTIRLVEDLSENGGLIRYNALTNNLDLGVSESGVDNTRISINRTTGNVGIGTTSPLDVVHIVGTSSTGLRVDGEVSQKLNIIGNIEVHPVLIVPSARIIGPMNRSIAMEINGNGPTDRFSVVTDLTNAGNASSEAFVVTNAGKVGIGTSAPVAALQAHSTAGGVFTGLYISNEPAGSGLAPTQISFSRTGAASKITSSITSDITTSGTFANGYLAFSTRTSESVTEKMRIDSTGNVGIGTSAPATYLDIAGNGGETIILRDKDSLFTDNAFVLYIRGKDSANNNVWYMGEGSSGAKNVSMMAYQAGYPLTFGTSSTERMRVDDIGNVGIGTTAPNTLLQIGPTGPASIGYSTFAGSYLSTAGQAQYVGNWASTGYWGIGPATNANDNTLRIGRIDTASATWNATQVTSLLIGGNIGIGGQINVTGNVQITSGSALRIGAANICTSAGCVSSSDLRLKENIQPLDFSLEKLLSLKGVQYDWKNKAVYGDQHQIGFIAQELEKVFPEVVYTDKETGLKTVSYGQLLAPVVEAIKVLFGKTKDNTRAIASLEEKDSAKDKQIKALTLENERKDKELREMKERLDRIEKALAR